MLEKIIKQIKNPQLEAPNQPNTILSMRLIRGNSDGKLNPDIDPEDLFDENKIPTTVDFNEHFENGKLVEAMDPDELFDENCIPKTQELFSIHGFNSDVEFNIYKNEVKSLGEQLRQKYIGLDSYPFDFDRVVHGPETYALNNLISENNLSIQRTASEHFEILPEYVVNAIRYGSGKKFEFYGAQLSNYDKKSGQWVESINTRIGEEITIDTLFNRFLRLEQNPNKPNYGQYSLSINNSDSESLVNITINQIANVPGNKHGHIAYLSKCISPSGKTVLFITTLNAGEKLDDKVQNVIASYALVCEKGINEGEITRKMTLTKIYSNSDFFDLDGSFDNEVSRMTVFDTVAVGNLLDGKESDTAKTIRKTQNSIKILIK
jgi:hypothetical protein